MEIAHGLGLWRRYHVDWRTETQSMVSMLALGEIEKVESALPSAET